MALNRDVAEMKKIEATQNWREILLPFTTAEFTARLSTVALPYSVSPLTTLERLGDKRRLLHRDTGAARELYVRGYIDGYFLYEIAAAGRQTRFRYQPRTSWVSRLSFGVCFAVMIPGSLYVIDEIVGRFSVDSRADWVTLLVLALLLLIGWFWVVREQRNSQWREIERVIRSLANQGSEAESQAVSW